MKTPGIPAGGKLQPPLTLPWLLTTLPLRGHVTFQLEATKILNVPTEVLRLSEYYPWLLQVKNPDTSYLFRLSYFPDLFSSPRENQTGTKEENQTNTSL